MDIQAEYRIFRKVNERKYGKISSQKGERKQKRMYNF